MDELAVRTATEGFFTRAEARDAGYDDRMVSTMMRAGEWHRIRRGYYTATTSWSAMDEVERHRLRSRAVLHSLGPNVALSHVSGALAHGIATWGVPLDRVHVTRLDQGAGRIEPDLVHHHGRWLADDVVEVDGLRVLVPARCALETSILTTNEAALVHLDSLLNRGLCDPDQLMQRFGSMGSWPGIRHLHIPVRMADGRSESPGESRGRWLFRLHRIPAPVLQFEVRDRDGVLWGTCDWAWPDHRCLGEFDGRCKYGRLLKPGQDAGDVLFSEKTREDMLRQLTDYLMVRLVWEDYHRPLLTARRIREKLRIPN